MRLSKRPRERAEQEPKPSRRSPRQRLTDTLRRGVSQTRGNLRGGARATRGNLGGVPAAIARRLLALLGLIAGSFFDLLGVVINLLLALAGLLVGPLRRVLRMLGRLVGFGSRELTPARGLAAVAAAAAVLLALSQFADYRAISIGAGNYSAVETVAPAPETERAQTGSAHGYAMLPLAGLSLLVVGAAMRGRWRLTRLIVAIGVAVVLISLLIDRPAGLDVGDAADRYADAEASLLGGWWAQMFAGVLLAVSAGLLGRELRATAPARARGSRRSRRRERAVGGGAPAEGAKA